jgi:hypothetical protein
VTPLASFPQFHEPTPPSCNINRLITKNYGS